MTRKLAIFVLFLTVATAQAQKKRVAVMNFDYATVQSGVQALFGSNQDIGKGIADLLVDKLVQDGVYSVIERKELDKILAEQNFSNSDRADPSSAAKIARVLGVDAIIIGSITQFGRDDKKTDVGGGALGGVTGRFGIGGVRKSESKAVVQVTGRMIDTSTAEILASASGKGESQRSGTGLLGSGGSAYNMGGGSLDMKSSNFGQTILGEATNKAVDQMASQLEAKASSLPTVTVTVSGLVADAAPDGTVIVNVGKKNGLKSGDKLQIKRQLRVVRDPATNKILRSVDEPVGTLTLTDVDDSSAVGKFSGSGTPKVGDIVSNH
ncbi:MAG TPA: CsgG/HfaB family protein [Candidatus Limnocylindrales bacterium]|nr:CsgG/HfaB family protein [Candidatus Limnocylindrales bacterium]